MRRLAHHCVFFFALVFTAALPLALPWPASACSMLYGMSASAPSALLLRNGISASNSCALPLARSGAAV